MNQEQAVNAELYLVGLESGAALLVGNSVSGGVTLYAMDDQIQAFSVRNTDPKSILQKSRQIAMSLVRGDLHPEMSFPKNQPQMDIIATFSGTSGHLMWASEVAPQRWKILHQLSERTSFITRTSTLRLIREYSDEIYPGILVTPVGEIAVRDGQRWIPVDELDPEDVHDEIVPRVMDHLGGSVSQEQLLMAMLRLVQPHIAAKVLFSRFGNAQK